MNFRLFALAGAAVLALSACDSDENLETESSSNLIQGVKESTPENALDVELPPAIVTSAAYRCDDGKALYVDILEDKVAVLVRNSRTDTPVRLDRESETGPFDNDDRSLSGTGANVTYSSPDRPNQLCRRADS